MRSLLSFFNSKLGKTLRYLVSAALLVAFVSLLDWRELGALREQLSVWPAVWAVLLAGLAYALHAPRWWLLLHAQGLNLSHGWTQRVTWIGTFYNSFLLGGLGGDAARVFYVCRDAPDRRAGGIAATLLDRGLGLVVLLCVAAGALVIEAGVLAREPSLRWVFFGAVAAFVLGLSGLVWLLGGRKPAAMPAWLTRSIGPALSATLLDLLGRVRSSRKQHVQALVISFAIWLLDFVSIWLVATAAGLPLPFLKTCIAASVAYAATALPISVGGHGVREGALLLVLQAFGLISAGGAGYDRALLIALGTWAITIFWSGVGGVVLLTSPTEYKKPANAPIR